MSYNDFGEQVDFGIDVVKGDRVDSGMDVEIVDGNDKNSSTINTSTEFLYIYDFNKNISITDINKYFSLGLKQVNSTTGANIVVSVDTHVEVIS